MSVHTKGPWHVVEFKHSVGVLKKASGSDYSNRVCELPYWGNGGGQSEEEAVKLGHLLSAAPELLEALEAYINLNFATNAEGEVFSDGLARQYWTDEYKKFYDSAIAAISKAKGDNK